MSGAIRVPVWPTCSAWGRQPALVTTRDPPTAPPSRPASSSSSAKPRAAPDPPAAADDDPASARRDTGPGPAPRDPSRGPRDHASVSVTGTAQTDGVGEASAASTGTVFGATVPVTLTDADLAVHVTGREAPDRGRISLIDAPGRDRRRTGRREHGRLRRSGGPGRPAGRRVGGSRVVTSAGWRPHSTRSARPGRGSRRTSTSPAGSAGRSSTSSAARRPSTSSRSTRTPSRRS